MYAAGFGIYLLTFDNFLNVINIFGETIEKVVALAILMPIVIPIAHLIPQMDPAITGNQEQAIFLSTIASVLAGATFGDHCSPISDTTIMSSMASGADHMDHVRTQLPYAIFAGILSIIVGYLPIGFGVSPLIMLPVGVIIIVLSIRFLAPKVEES